MADATYQPKVYRKQGGDELVVASSGKITVESGGQIDMSSATGSILFAAGEIETADLADDAITSSKIADDAVGSSHIADSAVLSSHIADDAINSSKIADDAVTSSHIADGAVQSSHLASTSVRATKLDANLGHGVLDFNLFGAKVVSSTGGEWFSSGNAGFLTSATTPALTMGSTDLRGPLIAWSSGAVGPIQLPPVTIPFDMTTQAAIKIKMRAAADQQSTADVTGPKLQVRAWFGSTVAVLSSLTGQIGSTAFSTFSVGFSSGSLAAWPNPLSVELSCTNSTQQGVRISNVWLDYTRQSSGA